MLSNSYQLCKMTRLTTLNENAEWQNLASDLSFHFIFPRCMEDCLGLFGSELCRNEANTSTNQLT